jgi:PAS domain S-box-containing protein
MAGIPSHPDAPEHADHVALVSDPFLVIDASWRLIYVNTPVCEMFKRRPEDLLGKDIWAAFPEWAGKSFGDAWKRAFETQIPAILEVLSPGEGLWSEQRIYPSPSGLRVLFFDITSRKRAEASLRESEDRYRTLLEQAADGIFVADNDGFIIETNAEGLRLSGYSREELLRMNIRDLVPREDLVRDPFRFDDLRAGKVITSARRLRCRDGSLKEIEVCTKFLSDGRLQGIVRDISERRLIEQEVLDWKNRYDLIIAASGQLVYEYDVKTGAIVWGGNLQQVLGLSPGEMGGGIGQWKEMIHSEDRDEALRMLEISERTLAPYDVEYRFRYRDGT